MQKIQVPPLMTKPLRDYEQYCRDRLHLRPTTLRERMREIAIFADFLRSRDITILDQMQPADLSAFVTSLHRLAAKTVSRIVSDVRSFLQFLLLRGILQRDLSHVLPKPHHAGCHNSISLGPADRGHAAQCRDRKRGE